MSIAVYHRYVCISKYFKSMTLTRVDCMKMATLNINTKILRNRLLTELQIL